MTIENRQDEAGHDERRVAPRIRTLKRARLMFNNRFSTIDCVVRNVSATGALLTVDTAVQLPRTFEIRIGEDESEVRTAKLVYRREMFAGIHFTDQNEATAVGPGAVQPVDAAEGNEPGIEPVRSAPLPSALRGRLPWSDFY